MVGVAAVVLVLRRGGGAVVTNLVRSRADGGTVVPVTSGSVAVVGGRRSS